MNVYRLADDAPCSSASTTELALASECLRIALGGGDGPAWAFTSFRMNVRAAATIGLCYLADLGGASDFRRGYAEVLLRKDLEELDRRFVIVGGDQ